MLKSYVLYVLSSALIWELSLTHFAHAYFVNVQEVSTDAE